MGLPEDLNEKLTDEMKAVLSDIESHGVEMADVFYTAIHMYLTHVRHRLITVAEMLNEQQHTFLARRLAAQKALDEEDNRIYTTPVTEEEIQEALRRHKINHGRDQRAREQYGEHYMRNFHAWMDRLCEERGRKCQRCGATNRKFTIHHRSYRNRGNETSVDLALLCRKCHNDYHKRYRQKQLTPEDYVCIDRENEYWRGVLMGGSDMESITNASDEILRREVDVPTVVRNTIINSREPIFVVRNQSKG